MGQLHLQMETPESSQLPQRWRQRDGPLGAEIVAAQVQGLEERERRDRGRHQPGERCSCGAAVVDGPRPQPVPAESEVAQPSQSTDTKGQRSLRVPVAC